MICGTPRYSHITPIHYLCRSESYLRSKSSHSRQFMEWRQDMSVIWSIKIRKHERYPLRSTKELLLMAPTVKTKETPGDRAYAAAAPAVWNKPLSYIRSEQSVRKFKTLLKTHLFRQAFACFENN